MHILFTLTLIRINIVNRYAVFTVDTIYRIYSSIVRICN